MSTFKAVDLTSAREPGLNGGRGSVWRRQKCYTLPFSNIRGGTSQGSRGELARRYGFGTVGSRGAWGVRASEWGGRWAGCARVGDASEALH